LYDFGCSDDRSNPGRLRQQRHEKGCNRWFYLHEIVAASKNGALKEIFASGTAAVISPIGWLNIKGEDMQVADGKVGTIAQRLYDKLYGMQTGVVEDDMGWTYPLGF
jgi:branched-chain amino acid aminotransferase